jgi:hypothetical protein
LIYESIVRNAPITVPAILAAGLIAVTVYRPQFPPTAPGVASMPAKSGSSSIGCADASVKGMLAEKEQTAANATATDQVISQACP